MANDRNTDQDQLSEKREKKAYRSPTVRPYGNIREITWGTGHNGGLDGTKVNPHNKTQF
jgi:hypothetical protein